MKLSASITSLLVGGAIFTQTACTSAANANIVAPEPAPPVIKANAVNSYVLLDRTGSMRGIWDEALGSVNAYVDELAKPDRDGETVKGEVTLAVFDFQQSFQFDVLRDGVAPSDWVSVTEEEVSPRGMTPLFDAIGQILNIAEADNPEAAVIVIMTDGRENSSEELNSEDTKKALDKAKEKGWEVVFLGADFASFGDAEAVGVSAAKSMAISPLQLETTQRSLANKVKGYAKGEETEIYFDAEDRAEAGEEEVKQRKGQ